MSSMAKQKSTDVANVSLISSMFRIGLYKPAQGRIVRQVSFVAFMILAWLVSWNIGEIAFVAEMFSSDQSPISNWLCLLIFGSLGTWISYRIVNHPPFADFMIAVEAEMNKVSWPTWPELWKASLVVIFVIFSMALALFLFDVVWSWFFGEIGVRYIV